MSLVVPTDDAQEPLVASKSFASVIALLATRESAEASSAREAKVVAKSRSRSAPVASSATTVDAPTGGAALALNSYVVDVSPTDLYISGAQEAKEELADVVFLFSSDAAEARFWLEVDASTGDAPEAKEESEDAAFPRDAVEARS